MMESLIDLHLFFSLLAFYSFFFRQLFLRVYISTVSLEIFGVFFFRVFFPFSQRHRLRFPASFFFRRSSCPGRALASRGSVSRR